MEFVKFFLLLLLGLVIDVFDVKLGVLYQFVFARFAFLMYFLQLCALALLACSYTSLLHRLPAQSYAYYARCLVFWQAQS